MARADDDGGPARGPGPEDGGSAQWRPVIGEVREEVRARAKTAWIELARRGKEGGGTEGEGREAYAYGYDCSVLCHSRGR